MGRYANVRPSKWTKPPAYPFIISKLSKSPGQTRAACVLFDAARLALPDFAAALRAKRLRPSR
jgi:hypothetical protein